LLTLLTEKGGDHCNHHFNTTTTISIPFAMNIATEDDMGSSYGFDGANNASDWARCMCCGRPSENTQRHGCAKMMHVSSEERGCLFGRAGITIQELVRRCRVCICAERKRVVVAGPNAEIVERAIVLIRGRLENTLRERRQKRSALLGRAWYTRVVDPEEVLASRPPGRWHFVDGQLVCDTHRNTSTVLATCSAAVRNLFTHGMPYPPASKPSVHHAQKRETVSRPTPTAARPLAISWQSIAAAGCSGSRHVAR
jgi:hypothetical protein